MERGEGRMAYIHKQDFKRDRQRKAEATAARHQEKREADLAARRRHPVKAGPIPARGKRRDAWEAFERQVYFPEVFSLAFIKHIREADGAVEASTPCECYKVLGGDKCAESRFCTVVRLAKPDRHGDFWEVPKEAQGPCAGRAKLEPHHIQRQGSHPELRFALANIVAVSPGCHDRIPAHLDTVHAEAVG
jgi:hypothetical protein